MLCHTIAIISNSIYLLVKNSGKAFFLGFVLLIMHTSVVAEEIVVLDEELQTLLTLDLEDLTSVSVASKRSEALQDAPGIITVVKIEEIQRYGYRNLRDVLDRQTHMQIIGSNVFPHDRVSLRGSTYTHTDNTVLLLINGRPFRDGFGVSNNQDVYQAFPVESIQQLEIIRGPGSVLYGTNAFAGVINIVTKDAPDTPSGEATFTYGSFSTNKGTASGGGKWGDFEIFGALNVFHNNGDDFDNVVDEFGTRGTYHTGQEGESIIINAKYKGFTVNALHMDTAIDQHNSTFIFPSDNIDTERQFIDVGYKHDLTDNWDVSANFLYHHYHFDFFPIPGIEARNDYDHFFVELSSNAALTDGLNVLVGGTYNLIDGFSDLGRNSVNTYTVSAYAQVDYWVTDWLKLIAGTQWNKPEHLSGDLSPRFSAIIHFNEQWGAKAMYGEAFREASPVERFVNVPQLLGNPDLEPETIKTFDAQLFYSGKRGSIAATYFHSEQELIERVGVTPQRLENSGEVEYDGFELEGKWNFGHGLSFLGNLSYQTNEKNDGRDEVSYAPDWMVKTGLSYESERGYTFSLFNSYFAASTLQNQDINPTVANVNPDADGYNLLTANFELDLSRYLNNPLFKGTRLSIYGDNLLNEDIYFPSISRVTVNSIPHHQGRGVYITLGKGF